MSRYALALATGFLAAVAVACSDQPLAPSPEQPHHANDQTFDPHLLGRSSRGFEDEILRAEKQIPGLGGIYVDKDGSPVIFLKDISKKGVAMSTLANLAPTLNVDEGFRHRLADASVTQVRQGQFTFSELVAWEEAFSRAVRAPGFLSIDADEALNRVRVTIAPNASKSGLGAQISAAGIPDSAVVFEVRPPAVSLTTLRDKYRPTAGGMQIRNDDTDRCTLGFNVNVLYYGQKGFLTAGHCATSDRGGVTGDGFYQNNVSGANFVGYVSLNPSWNYSDVACRSYPVCTKADVIYVDAADSTSSQWALNVGITTSIGTSNSPGSITLSAFQTGLTLAPYTYVGLTVDKVGRTSGWTRGTLTSTCENPLVDSLAGPYVALCVDRVEGASVGPGDSGSPVFWSDGSSPTYAIGILFAGSGTAFSTPSVGDQGTYYCTAGCYYYYNPWWNIETHLTRYFRP